METKPQAGADSPELAAARLIQEIKIHFDAALIIGELSPSFDIVYVMDLLGDLIKTAFTVHGMERDRHFQPLREELARWSGHHQRDEAMISQRTQENVALRTENAALREEVERLKADHVAEIAGLRAEKDAAVFMPGVWKCPKCAFELTKSTLYVKSGAIGPNLDKPEACPNDGEAMGRVTWQEASKSNYDFAVKLLDERDALRTKLTAAEARCTALAKTLESAAAAFSNSGNELMAGICDDATRNHQS